MCFFFQNGFTMFHICDFEEAAVYSVCQYAGLSYQEADKSCSATEIYVAQIKERYNLNLLLSFGLMLFFCLSFDTLKITFI